MKKTILFLVALSQVFLCFAQAPTFQWAKSFGGAHNEIVTSMVIGSQDNVFITGTFSASVDFDPGIGTNLLTCTGSEDAFISNLDSSGNLIWVKTIAGVNSRVNINKLVRDAAGSMYAVGSFSGTVDFDPGTNVATLSAFLYSQAFIVKLDANGNFVWVRTIEGESEAFGVNISSTNDVFLCGSFRGLTDFDPGVTTAHPQHYGGEDGFVLHLNAAGNYVWVKTFGGNGDERCNDVLPVYFGVYCTGYFESGAKFAGNYGVLPNGGGKDIFILGLNYGGAYVSGNSFGGPGMDYISSLSASSTSVFVIGSFYNTSWPNAQTATFSDDIFITALNFFGPLLWTKVIGGSASDIATSNFSGSERYIVGSFGSTVDFDPGPGTFNMSAGNKDVFVCKFDLAWNFISATSVGGSGTARGISLGLSGSGAMYTAGYFDATGDYDPNTGTSYLFSAGGTDAFVYKMFTCSQPSKPTYQGSYNNICTGNSATLIAGGYGLINWYSSPPPAAPVASGVSWITPTLTAGNYTYYADATICNNKSLYFSVTLKTDPSPIITVVSTRSLICEGETVTLTPNGAVSYSWSGIGTNSAIAVNPLVNNTYTVTGVGVNGCKTSFVFSQNTNKCIGLPDYFSFEEPTIYPNPTNGIFAIHLQRESNITLTDLSGKVIVKGNTESGTHKVDLNDKPTGIYFLEIKNDIGSKVIKVVKE